MMREEKEFIEYLSLKLRKFWCKLLRADKPKKRDTKTNNFYLNLLIFGVVIFNVTGALITRFEAKNDFSLIYTYILMFNLLSIYFASLGLMKLYRRAKRTEARVPEFKRAVQERNAIKSIRKARTHNLAYRLYKLNGEVDFEKLEKEVCRK